MINKRIFLSGLSIVSAFALMVGGTFAFFSDEATSTGNTFSTGTLNIEITDQNSTEPFENETVIENWAPGEEALVNFDVLNSGSLPLHLRGFAAGSWGDEDLDALNKVKVTMVERWNGSSWETLATNPAGFTGYFYYTDNGADGGTYFDVEPGSRAQLRLTVVLDSTADELFEGQTFTSSLTVEAKQTNAPWE